MNRHVLTRAAFALALSIAAMPAFAAATLAPHRAFYDLEVKRLEQGGGISSITGKLAYEITGSSCEGYAVNYRIANRIRYSEGITQFVDTQLTSWESGDGLEMDVSQKQFLDAKLSSESRIKVKKAGVGEAGKGEIIAPQPKRFETDKAAVFPTSYQIRLIEAAIKGDARDESLVFEGSEEEKPIRAISFIGARKAKVSLSAETDQATAQQMNGMKAWPVTVSYFSADGGGDEQPIYQASFTMLENGVSTDLVLDYGTYALKGKLAKLELLKSEPCE